MNKAAEDAADVAEKTKLQYSPALDAWWWALAALFFPRLGPAWPIRGFSLSLSLPLLFPLLFSSSLPLLPLPTLRSVPFILLLFSPSLFISSSLSLSCLSPGSLLSSSLSSLSSLLRLLLLLLRRLVSQDSSSSPLSSILSCLIDFVFSFLVINALFSFSLSVPLHATRGSSGLPRSSLRHPRLIAAFPRSLAR